ncbi:MAG: hypothetical protein R2707_01115 [Acidimicrobiales bacterium]
MVDEARVAAGRPRGGAGAQAAVGVLVGMCLLTGIALAWFWWETEGAWHSVPALSAEVDDDLAIAVSVGCIDGEIRASVAERADRVLVMVEIRGERSDNDCLHGVGVTLPERLAGRELIDWHTGDPISTG